MASSAASLVTSGSGSSNSNANSNSNNLTSGNNPNLTGSGLSEGGSSGSAGSVGIEKPKTPVMGMVTATQTASPGTIGSDETMTVAGGDVSISVHPDIAAYLECGTRETVQVDFVLAADFEADRIELAFRDQFVSRADMWLEAEAMHGQCLHLTQRLDRSAVGDQRGGARLLRHGIKCDVSVIESQQPNAITAVVGPRTRLIFRTLTARITLLLQMSRELWEYAPDGELYFDKLLNGVLWEMFRKWRAAEASHRITVVLFSRSWLAGQNHTHSNVSLAIDSTKYHDFYRVVCDEEQVVFSDAPDLSRESINMGEIDWRTLQLRLKRAFHSYLEDVEKVVGTNATNTTAREGNALEAIHVALSSHAAPYCDRDLRACGRLHVMVSPGSGVFDVSHALARSIKRRLLKSGTGCDVICLAPPPLHAIPLLRYRSSKEPDKISSTVPHWLQLCFAEPRRASFPDGRSHGTKEPAAQAIWLPDVSLPKNVLPVAWDIETETEDTGINIAGNGVDRTRGSFKMLGMREQALSDVGDEPWSKCRPARSSQDTKFSPFSDAVLKSGYGNEDSETARRWGALQYGDQHESNPAMRFPNWASITSPALLPLAGICQQHDLDGFEEGVYAVSLWERISIVTSAYPHVQPRALAEFLLKQLVAQRLSHGFQLIPVDALDEIISGRTAQRESAALMRQRHGPLAIQGSLSSGSSLRRATDIQNSDRPVGSQGPPRAYALRFGKVYHRLALDSANETIEVKRFARMKHEPRDSEGGGQSETLYPFYILPEYGFGQFLPCSMSSGVGSDSAITSMGSSFPWNAVDHMIAGEDDEQSFSETLNYNRQRFLLLRRSHVTSDNAAAKHSLATMATPGMSREQLEARLRAQAQAAAEQDLQQKRATRRTDLQSFQKFCNLMLSSHRKQVEARNLIVYVEQSSADGPSLTGGSVPTAWSTMIVDATQVQKNVPLGNVVRADLRASAGTIAQRSEVQISSDDLGAAFSAVGGSEWLLLRYDNVFSNDRPYLVEIDWLSGSARGRLVEEYVTQLERKARLCGFELRQVPTFPQGQDGRRHSHVHHALRPPFPVAIPRAIEFSDVQMARSQLSKLLADLEYAPQQCLFGGPPKIVFVPGKMSTQPRSVSLLHRLGMIGVLATSSAGAVESSLFLNLLPSARGSLREGMNLLHDTIRYLASVSGNCVRLETASTSNPTIEVFMDHAPVNDVSALRTNSIHDSSRDFLRSEHVASQAASGTAEGSFPVGVLSALRAAKDSNVSKACDADWEELANWLKEKLPVSGRTFLGVRYENVFSGMELIRILQEHAALEGTAGREVGTALVKRNSIRHCGLDLGNFSVASYYRFAGDIETGPIEDPQP